MMSDTSYSTKKLEVTKKTIEVDVTFTPATRFEWVLNNNKHIGYIDEAFDRFDDSELKKYLENRIELKMGYGSNIIYLIKEEVYDSSQPTAKMEEKV